MVTWGCLDCKITSPNLPHRGLGPGPGWTEPQGPTQDSWKWPPKPWLCLTVWGHLRSPRSALGLTCMAPPEGPGVTWVLELLTSPQGSDVGTDGRPLSWAAWPGPGGKGPQRAMTRWQAGAELLTRTAPGCWALGCDGEGQVQAEGPRPIPVHPSKMHPSARAQSRGRCVDSEAAGVACKRSSSRVGTGGTHGVPAAPWREGPLQPPKDRVPLQPPGDPLKTGSPAAPGERVPCILLERSPCSSPPAAPPPTEAPTWEALTPWRFCFHGSVIGGSCPEAQGDAPF